MKYFAYTVKQTRRNGGREYDLTLYRIKKNVLCKIGVYSYSFESDGQNVINAAIHFGQIEAFKTNNGDTCYSKLVYAERNIAQFQEV